MLGAINHSQDVILKINFITQNVLVGMVKKCNINIVKCLIDTYVAIFFNVKL